MATETNVSSFQTKLSTRRAGILSYGMTPPKEGTADEKLHHLGSTQRERLVSLQTKIGIDAVVMYDIQDEKERNPNPRPFPFMDTVDGVRYLEQYLQLPPTLPTIVYRCTAKYTAKQFEEFLAKPIAAASVFVGASARDQSVHFTMREAYEMRARWAESTRCMPIGGVAIPERHEAKGDEHHRILHKIAEGCTFFITQCVYNVEHAKTFLSDYYYACRDAGVPMVPILITLTPCGSKKTLQFMEWLGIKVSKWLQNDLVRAEDASILQLSVEACEATFRDLWTFSAAKGIPLGANIESLAIRKSEIDASMDLVRRVKDIMEGVPASPVISPVSLPRRVQV